MKQYVMYSAILLVTFSSSCNDKKNENVSPNDNTAMQNDSMNTSRMETNETENSESSFVNEWHQTNMLEVELGAYASSNAASKAVKDYGSMMAKEHAAADNKLKTATAVMLTDSILTKHKEDMNELKARNGSDFDKAYMKMVVDGHEETIDELKSASENEKMSAAVRNYATESIAVIQKHLDEAKKIKDKL